MITISANTMIIVTAAAAAASNSQVHAKTQALGSGGLSVLCHLLVPATEGDILALFYR